MNDNRSRSAAVPCVGETGIDRLRLRAVATGGIGAVGVVPRAGHAGRPHEPEVPSTEGNGPLRVARWLEGRIEEAEGTSALRSIRDRDCPTTWIDLCDPSPEQVAAVTDALGLHPLIAEDILEGNQRAKIEVTDDLVHIVMFALPRGSLTSTAPTS